MKEESWTKVMEEISDIHVVEAVRLRRKHRRPLWMGLIAVAVVAAVVLGNLFWKEEKPVMPTAQALSLAVYPETAVCPYLLGSGPENGERMKPWLNDRVARATCSKQYQGALDGFLATTIPQLLAGHEGQNRMYSPLSLYMSLAMLAEITDGESREQVLGLLGAPDLETLRLQAQAVWKANYVNDGASTRILATSLWLSEDVDFVQKTMDRLAETYHTSSYQVEMGTQGTNQALREWIIEQTGGLLQEQAQGLEFHVDTVLALASTVHYRAKWQSAFAPERTQGMLFYGFKRAVNYKFIKQRSVLQYYQGENFSAVFLPMEGGGGMWLMLPEEGGLPEELLNSGEVVRFLLNQEIWENSTYPMVDLIIPKMNITSDLDLRQELQALGVTDVFDAQVSDFTPMTEQKNGICIGEVSYAIQVVVDEEGSSAADYTVMGMEGTHATQPEETIEFDVRRPFLYAITGEDGLPLFIGTYYEPDVMSQLSASKSR